MRLTTRLVTHSLGVIGVVLIGVAVLTYELVNVAGRDDVDRLVRDEADALTDRLAIELVDATGLDGVLSPPEAERAARSALVLHPSGARHVSVLEIGGVRLQSEGGPPEVATLLRGRLAPEADGSGSIRTLDTDAGPLRVLDRLVMDAGGAPVAQVMVVAPLDDVRGTALGVLRRGGAAAAVGMLVGGVALWAVVRRSLAPLGRLSEAAAGISSRDLTARVPVPSRRDEVAELATELNRMLDRIEHDHTTRQRYLAAVSHEVRTPLAVAEGHLELLASLGPGDPDESRRTADTVRLELQRLRQVLDDLIAVNRGETALAVREEAVFVPDLVDGLRRRVEGLHLSERIRFGPAPNVAIVSDQARLEQCVANLLQNAIDHTPPTTRVEVRVEAPPDGFVIEVIDDGPGIAPDLLPDVFEPFVTSRDTGSAGGTAGLGLAVVRSLTEALGGTITAESSPAGTTMRMEFSRP